MEFYMQVLNIDEQGTKRLINSDFCYQASHSRKTSSCLAKKANASAVLCDGKPQPIGA